MDLILNSEITDSQFKTHLTLADSEAKFLNVFLNRKKGFGWWSRNLFPFLQINSPFISFIL